MKSTYFNLLEIKNDTETHGCLGVDTLIKEFLAVPFQTCLFEALLQKYVLGQD